MQLTIDKYTKMVAPLDVRDLDLANAFHAQPLDAGVLRCLRYMHDIEMHTICYLRDLLVTSAHRDPEITTFLTFWSFEEYWHGEAIADVLRAHGEPAGAARVRELRRTRRVAEATKPFAHGLASMVVGPSMTAVHMTWGAINEWTTQAGYAMLAQRCDHPVLAEMLRRIMRQEGRHIDFYAAQATKRLAENRRAQWLTRQALTRFWAPVGSDVMPEEEVRHLISFLFGGADGAAMAARIDRRIDGLPGLGGLGLVGKARGSATSELGHDRGERLDIVGTDDHVADAPALAAA
ncbi:MAG: ferritin-like domain-containing protein [Ilumatobacteraceae bacterium]